MPHTFDKWLTNGDVLKLSLFFFADEVDILGYGSSPSDTDESCGSDGYSIDSKRLVLNSSPYSESL